MLAQGGAAGFAVEGAGQRSCRAEQIVADRGGHGPGGVGVEVPAGQVCQGAVDEVGKGGFDDGVPPVGEVGFYCG
jgi:hypothetical protein